MNVKFSKECLSQPGPRCDLVDECERPAGCKYAGEKGKSGPGDKRGEVGGSNKTRIVDGGSMDH